MIEETKDYLQGLVTQLIRAKDTLNYSYKICYKIGKKETYSEDEKDRFESLTSKFARLSDLIIKKIIKTIDILDLDDPAETIRDVVNRAEKKNLINSAIEYIEIRKIRNEIAHEYFKNENDIMEINQFVLKKVPVLMSTVDKILKYCQEKNYLVSENE
jgi:uncharacterized protein with HEPN domain